MRYERVALLGGSGFVGRHLTHRLVAEGHGVRVLARHPHRHRDLALLPGVEVVGCDVHDPAALTAALRGCRAAVNLVGILNERGFDGSGFRRAHVELPHKVTQACLDAGVRRLLHMSALGADAARGPSHYLRSKGEGENVAHGVAPNEVAVTSFRPSLIFGPGDSLFNRFAALLRLAPGLFPLACPEARFAPVYVGDVAAAFAAALENPATFGRRYELCGPRVYTLRELVAYTAAALGLRCRVVGLPDGAARLQARLLERLPGKPFTTDNYLSLQLASVCKEEGLATLGIAATPLETVVPGYLAAEGGRNGRYAEARRRAGR